MKVQKKNKGLLLDIEQFSLCIIYMRVTTNAIS